MRLILLLLVLTACAEESKKPCTGSDLCLPSPPTDHPGSCEQLPGPVEVKFLDGQSKQANVFWCSSGCVTYQDVLDIERYFVICK